MSRSPIWVNTILWPQAVLSVARSSDSEEDASNIDEGKKKAPLAPRSYCALCGHGYKVLPSLLLLHAIFVEISPCLPLCVYLPHTITVTPNLCLPLCLISIILLPIHPHNTKPSILASTHLIAKAPHKMFTPQHHQKIPLECLKSWTCHISLRELLLTFGVKPSHRKTRYHSRLSQLVNLFALNLTHTIATDKNHLTLYLQKTLSVSSLSKGGKGKNTGTEYVQWWWRLTWMIQCGSPISLCDHNLTTHRRYKINNPLMRCFRRDFPWFLCITMHIGWLLKFGRTRHDPQPMMEISYLSNCTTLNIGAVFIKSTIFSCFSSWQV